MKTIADLALSPATLDELIDIVEGRLDYTDPALSQHTHITEAANVRPN